MLSAHIKPPPPLPNGSESRRYLRPYVFQPYQTPAITAPNIRKRVKENQPAPDSGAWNLSRCASAAERIAEDTVTDMILTKVLQLSQITRSMKTPSPPKKNVTYSCASLTSPVMADRPINGFKGTEMPFSVKQLLHSSPVDIKHQNQALDQKFMKYAQPFHWSFT